MNSLFNLSNFSRLGLFEGNSEVASIYEKIIEENDLSIADIISIRDFIHYQSKYDTELHLILISLFYSLSKGSLCVDLSKEYLSDMLSRWTDSSTQFVEKIVNKINDGEYSIIIGNEEEFKPIIILNNQLYFQKYLMNERKLQKRISYFVNKIPKNINWNDIKPVVDEVLSVDPALPEGYSLNAEQKEALATALIKPFSIISGGPGTGKTSIVVNILRILVRLGISPDQIKLSAPTGRAAQRVSESIRNGLSYTSENDMDKKVADIEGQTIHRLLSYNPSTGTFKYNQKNPVPMKVLIVDEVSMVDVILMARLLTAAPDDCRIILLGDKDQLPSVDAGAVLADLMPEIDNGFSEKHYDIIHTLMPELTAKISDSRDKMIDNVTTLVQSYRSQKDILDKALQINSFEGDDEESLALISALESIAPQDINSDLNGVGFVSCFNDHKKYTSFIELWLKNQFGSRFKELLASVSELSSKELKDEKSEILKELFELLQFRQILTLTRTGIQGSDFINKTAVSYLTSLTGQSGKFVSGIPIMIRSNDYRKKLFNGEVGLALKTTDSFEVYFESQGEYHSFSPESLPENEPALAITVHKSQGSEYKEVLLVMPDDIENRLLSRQILYTGLTRAKDLAVIYSDKEIAAAAVRTKSKRHSGLSLWE